MKSILITTKHRGVFFAQVEENADLGKETLTDLKECRMAIYWGTKNGVQELAKHGPTANSRISCESGIEAIFGVTAIFSVTKKAEKAWLEISK